MPRRDIGDEIKRKIREYRKSPIPFIEDLYIDDRTGKPLKLHDWQKEKILRPIFLTKDSRGLRQYKRAIIGLPTGNGKSTLAAGCAIWQMYFDEPGEIFGAANSKDQAKLIFNKMVKSIEAQPIFERDFKIRRDYIELPKTGSVYRVMSAEDIVAHGIEPQGVYFDEMHGQRDRKLYDVLYKSMIKRDQPLMIITSTAGEMDSILYELYKEALIDHNLNEVNSLPYIEVHGTSADPRLFMFWSFTNLLSNVVTEEKLEEHRRNNPPAVFQRWHENRWVGGSASFLPIDAIHDCADPSLISSTTIGNPRYTYVYAVDLGIKRDRTAAVVAHKDPDTGHIVIDRLKVWQAPPGGRVQIAEVEEDMEMCARNFNIIKLVCDGWQMQNTIQKFQERGWAIEEFTFTGVNLQKISSTLYSLIVNRQMRYPADEELLQELKSINTVQTSYGYRIDHKKSGYSDRVMAIGMAVVACIQESVYEPTITWV